VSQPLALPACPHRPPCPGCPRYGEPGISANARAVLNQLAHENGLPDVAVRSGNSAGFRLRARLAVRGRLGSPKLGLFESGTHKVVHNPYCSVQHPLINRVAEVVRGALIDANVSCYSELAHAGLVRHVQVVVERRSLSAQLVVVANSTDADPLAPFLSMVRDRLGDQLHSLWFNSNCERTNTILGPSFEKWCGADTVVEHFTEAAVHFPPGAFGQSNLEVATDIIGHVSTLIPLGARVAEFYAGVGAIGLSLVPRVSSIAMNEIGRDSLHGLELGIAALESSNRAKVSVSPGAAGAARRIAADTDVVVADPPRRGLDPELTHDLSEQLPRRLIYISCDLDSLRRDTIELLSPRKLRLSALAAFNLVPFTEHVETIAVFDRS
jgi:23S rRNA (uracil1939-C5)-methyltransferase